MSNWCPLRSILHCKNTAIGQRVFRRKHSGCEMQSISCQQKKTAVAVSFCWRGKHILDKYYRIYEYYRVYCRQRPFLPFFDFRHYLVCYTCNQTFAYIKSIYILYLARYLPYAHAFGIYADYFAFYFRNIPLVFCHYFLAQNQISCPEAL